MTDLDWPSSQATAVLRAMQTVAASSGRRVPLPVERELMLSLQRHVLRSAAEVDADALPYLSPPELRGLLPDHRRRQRALCMLATIPYVSLEVDAAKVMVVDAFAMGLGISPQTLRELHRHRERQLRRVALDHVRRSVPVLLTVRTASHLRGIVDAFRGHAGDAALASRYRTLAGLAPGTLGRGLYDLYRARGFPLPGEPGGLDETLVSHDVCHLLGGLDTDLAGEIAVRGLTAGMARAPFDHELLLDALVELHGGAHLSGLEARLAAPRFDVAGFAAAYERGRAIEADLLDGWPWWGAVGERVAVLRNRLGIRVADPQAASARETQVPAARGTERRGTPRAA